MRRMRYLFLCGPVLLVMTLLVTGQGTPKRPVYVGARVCGQCHAGQGMGNQYSLWLHSKHSLSWSGLARPEAKEIATISGLRQEPQESAICLGCHAPAGLAEDWEKDDTFHLEDGVQCEACHGPGSEYMDDEVMRNRGAAMKAGLKMPTEADCMTCHIEKGSHVAVLKSPQIDVKKAWKEIAHPTPPNAVVGSIPTPPNASTTVSGPKYAGSNACGKCHRGAMMGYQFSVWRRSRHALAFAVLGTPSGYEFARKNGVEGDPQKEPKCLKCHATGQEASAGFLDSFYLDDGVGCEACHGPGSDYMQEAIMRDRRAATAAGLKPVSRETCLRCHKDTREKPFDFEGSVKKIAHPTHPPVKADNPNPKYKTPLNMALRPDGRELYVACEASDSVVVVDPVAREKVAEIRVGGSPADVTFSPDGRHAFVSNRYDDTVSVVDVASRRVIKVLEAGDEPHGVLTDAQGKLLYVLNTTSEDMTVFDVASLSRVKTLSASRGPWSLARSPDASTILVTNMLSRIPKIREPFVSEVTVIETERGVVSDRWIVDGANMMMGIDWHPSGEFALATLNRTKSLVPMTQLIQGWTITNGLAILWRDGRVDQVLLDEPNMGFADATDVAITPDGRYAFVTSAGTDRIAVVDVNALISLVRGSSDYEREHVLPDHLGKSSGFIVKYIPTKNSPRGVLVDGRHRQAFVANALDDSLTVIDLARLESTGRVDLGGPRVITKQRWGERLFNNASITFRKQYACHSCHPDGHIDGITYDIEADGIGVSPVDNRTLRGILDTAPFKWEGTNPSLSRQCGARLAVFFTRLSPFTPEQLSAVDNYITTIQRPPNRFHPVGSRLTPAQRRGKVIFERTQTNDGREIAATNRCITCHPPPYYTDRRLHDVGTRHRFDRQGRFDTPHLNNIFDSAPYLHNGIAASLEEIWTVYNPNDKHGVTNDMTKDQLNDLIEFLKTL